MHSTFAKVWYEPEDPVPVVVGKAPRKMQNPDDFCEVLEVVPGEQLLSPSGMFGCHLEAYT
jgi:branched-chain amino acid transport system substrate-binding protein